MSESAEGYKLTDSDKALIRGMGAATSDWAKQGNIAALHFDGQMLVDMVRWQREFVDKRLPYVFYGHRF